MSLVKRLSTTFFSRIDQVVGEIENHDALIKASIGEQKKKLAAARVQLSKIHLSENRLKEQLAENCSATSKWQQRAIKEASTDEGKALLCLQRKQQTLNQQEGLQTMMAEYRQVRQKIEQDIHSCEAELKSMIQKHELMRARQSSVDAMQIISEPGSVNTGDLQSSFDRWEVQLSQGEVFNKQLDDLDLLEQEYIAEENDQSLKQELAELLKKQQSTSGE